MSDDDTYTSEDLRSLCFAAAEHFDWVARSCRRASNQSDSMAQRMQLKGRADMAGQAATYMRAVGNHK